MKLFVKVSYLFQSIFYGAQNVTKTKMSFILNQKVSSRFQVDDGRWESIINADFEINT